jgi:hypothetical protein
LQDRPIAEYRDLIAIAGSGVGPRQSAEQEDGKSRRQTDE